ncbi:carboxymuconolactone decarboxylase family protein [Hirschia litorea]|uniref:Carboxymuconolactone decarboxylase family protein n=1 Tax=Hirschia litorea TaxID=1199156 RepID=A0ABW2ILA1_9PROT
MSTYTLHTPETAPDEAKEILAGAKKTMGFVPNLYATMAQSPELLKSYKYLADSFASNSLNADERNVVWLVINYENNCHYCVPAHTGIAKSQGVSDDIINAIRDGKTIPNAKLEALAEFTRQMLNQRGVVTDEQVQALFAHGYDNTTVLDVILGLAHKTLSNYTNHVANTPVDEAFSKFAWTKPDAK